MVEALDQVPGWVLLLVGVIAGAWLPRLWWLLREWFLDVGAIIADGTVELGRFLGRTILVVLVTVGAAGGLFLLSALFSGNQ